jgi:UDP-N-acetyl-D-mannosaminuronate dehydrogenase
VTAYEPYKPDFQLQDLRGAATLEEAVAKAEMIVLLVGHKMLKEISPGHLSGITPARIALDTVNGWNKTEWEISGFSYSN